ncbi:MAG: tetratricopeptide repeat protein [Chitinivibrionales bacterium]|nr:tetratricopeptide repeat protein [Chitinivibrionales bacterium]
MFLQKRSTVIIVLTACFTFMLGASSPTFAQRDVERKKRELQEKLRKLQEQKFKMQNNAQRSQTSKRVDKGTLEQNITRFEGLLAKQCADKKSERCADIMFELATMYYDRARDRYIVNRREYEEAMDRWESSGARGDQPVNPIPDYSEALDMYGQLVEKYPQFKKTDEANYQIGNILLLAGELDKSEHHFRQIVENTPNSIRASAAWFRLGDFAYMNQHNSKALKCFEKVKKEEVKIEVWEMAHYRKAELYYNMAEFDKAVQLFFEYVERCDAGEYVKQEFRGEALEFMAISFSDMPNGATEAIQFFKKIGSRPYEDYIIYTIGMKNRDHGQFDDAIIALQTALKNYPYYKDAPIAQHKLIECYVVKKEHERANQEREKLVDYYQPGSEWYSKNSNERVIIDKARGHVKKALGNICLYYHSEAQQKKDKSLYEKALARYEEFFKKFPDDKWKVYEYKYNCAEVYNSLQEFGNAVDYYWYVATEDLSKYPEYRIDVDSLLYDDPKEYEKARMEAEKGGAKAISQADAGYNAIAALDRLRKKKIAMDGLSDGQAYALPETQKMLQFISEYQKLFPGSSNAAEVAYLGGNIHYMAKAYDKAIADFKFIIDTYATSKFADKSFRMLAKSYASSGEYDLALRKYKELLSRTDPKTKDYQEVIDLGAATIYQKAEEMEKAGNYMGAADVYKSILSEFPKSKVADRGWFEAAVCYEEAKSNELAAATFEELPVKFPKSTLREKAFVRAASNYEKQEKWELAANVYLKAANTITNAEFAIPTLASASECYEKIDNHDMAGKMYEIVFERYADDPKTPQALYKGALILEKGKLYGRAIKAYHILAEKYPKSEFSEDASFSIGICHEKAGNYSAAAEAFSDFAKKFSNKGKQIEALINAGDAYFKLGEMKNAENSYLSATALYDKFKDKGDFSVGSIARAHYRLGDIYSKEFNGIQLTGSRERDVKKAIKEKAKVLEKALKQYAKAVGTGVEEWVLRSTYQIGELFIDFADAEKNQKIFTRRADEKIAAQIKIIMKLEKYYVKAAEKYQWNIEKAHEQNISGSYVDSSINRFMEMGYRRGRLFEEVGELFANSPIPRGLSDEEKRAYKELLEEKRLEAMDAALPKYYEAMELASQLGISQSVWNDSIKARIRIIDPTSEWLTKEIVEWKPAPKDSTQQSMPQGQMEQASEEKGLASVENQSNTEDNSEDIENDTDKKKKRRKRRKRR